MGKRCVQQNLPNVQLGVVNGLIPLPETHFSKKKSRHVGQPYSKFSTSLLCDVFLMHVCKMKILCIKLSCLLTNKRNVRHNCTLHACHRHQIKFEYLNKLRNFTVTHADRNGGVRDVHLPINVLHNSGNFKEKKLPSVL